MSQTGPPGSVQAKHLLNEMEHKEPFNNRGGIYLRPPGRQDKLHIPRNMRIVGNQQFHPADGMHLANLLRPPK
jgi:hypothetical protein